MAACFKRDRWERGRLAITIMNQNKTQQVKKYFLILRA
jgi:hypothetical protein